MAMHELTFQPEGKTLNLFDPQLCVYQLDANSELRLRCGFAWCSTCQMVTPCETIESLQSIDRAMEYLRKHPDFRVDSLSSGSWGILIETEKMLGLEGSGLLWKSLSDLKELRSWRENRTSPPRCLICGSIQIVAVPNGELMPHPRRHGTIFLQCVAFADYTMGGWSFTPEGHRIPGTGSPVSWPGVTIPDSLK
jgi:hypothetical protein